MKQLSSGLHVPISYTPPPTRGYNGRESVATVQSGYKSQFNVLSPDASGSWKVQRLSPKELASMSVRDILSNLIRNSASMSFAVQTYADACVMGYDIVSESDRSVDIAKDFIRRIENGDHPFFHICAKTSIRSKSKADWQRKSTSINPAVWVSAW